MLAFSPGQAVIALPTTLETSVTSGDRLTYIRLVNEYGDLVDLNNLEYSLALEFECIYKL